MSDSPITPEAEFSLAAIRAKVRDGTPVSMEEVRAAVMALREGRARAAATSAKSRTAKAKAAPINSDDLLAGLENL